MAELDFLAMTGCHLQKGDFALEVMLVSMQSVGTGLLTRVENKARPGIVNFG